MLVTTPQRVALSDLKKSFRMLREAEVPVLGLVENMSYYLCGGCDKRHHVFGEGGGRRLAHIAGIPLLGELPLTARVPSEMGEGRPLLSREPDSEEARAFLHAADETAIATALQAYGWASAGSGAMEV